MTAFMDKRNDIGLLSPMIKYPDGRLQYLCKRNPTFIDLLIRLVFPRSFKKRHDYFEMKETGYNKEFEIEYATGCFMFSGPRSLKRWSDLTNISFYILKMPISQGV